MSSMIKQSEHVTFGHWWMDHVFLFTTVCGLASSSSPEEEALFGGVATRVAVGEGQDDGGTNSGAGSTIGDDIAATRHGGGR
jgi:hypothetical protein